MAATVSVTSTSMLASGEKIIRGTATLINPYTDGGEVLDISAYLSGSPTVIVNGDDGYVAQHDRGTAAAGKLVMYESGSASSPLDACDAGADNLSGVICTFIAIGTAV